jgi:hypothetical protein
MLYRSSWNDARYGLAYHCVDNVITTALDRVDDFKAEFHISDKNLKYVQDKLFLHYLFDSIMEFLRKNTTDNTFKPVLFLSEERIQQKDLQSEVIIKQLKLIKKLLPIPLLIPLSAQIFISNREGNLKELNEKIVNFYAKRKVSVRRLKNYFDDKGYSTISDTLSSMVNLKHLFY